MSKFTKRNIRHQEAVTALQGLSDDQLRSLQFSFPWQYSEVQDTKDSDGFGTLSASQQKTDRETIQKNCWDKFKRSPHVSTSIRGLVGRLTGYGFEISSENQEVQEVIQEIERDRRNRLWSFWPKYVGRAFIEGELFLLLSLHPDGFVEIDFIDPSNVSGGGDDGILYHPNKATMPLYYFVKTEQGYGYTKQTKTVVVPSIELAYFPNLVSEINKADLKGNKIVGIKGEKKYKALGGMSQFIVSWDRSFVTRRNISYLRTIIEWLNYYETLKKYEIDHKRSAGSFLWVVTINDVQSFRLWLGLSDEERRKTGIMAKKTPGGTLVLPPGMSLDVANPSLPNISESDTDIFHMISAGLNEPEDVLSGQSKGTFASVKASRGPMSDRVADEVAYFERFLRYDLFASIFFLRSAVTDFPREIKMKEAVDFKKKKPVFKFVRKAPEDLIDFNFPTSEVIDAETRARAYMGVKHGSVVDTLGVPYSEVSKKLGMYNYRKLRLMQATEEERYPELIKNIDAESLQEKKESEPSPKSVDRGDDDNDENENEGEE